MIVFTYPGQGSQTPGMGSAWVDHPSWELVEEASGATGRNIADLLLDTDADELTMTRNAQLSTFVTSMVVLDAVSRTGAEAAAHAGHSLGEYSALCAAGVLDFADAAKLVNERGDAMQAAADEQDGTMAAILGLDDDQVDVACQKTAGNAWIANYNAPGQVVIAGSPDDLDRACATAKELGANARCGSLSAAPSTRRSWHPPRSASQGNRPGRVPQRGANRLLQRRCHGAHRSRRLRRPSRRSAHLPVRWRQTLRALETDGFTTFVELGPGTVLTGLVKRAVNTAARVSVSTPADVDGLLETLQGTKTSDAAAATILEGEHLFATERMVVSPGAGIFTPNESFFDCSIIEVGQLLGTVGPAEVRSSFAGEIKGVLAYDGERVTSRQPIAWLRTTA